MKFLKVLRKTSIVAASLVATLALALCANRSLQLCLCEDDPDGCGEHCHECVPETDHGCNHIVIEMDAPSLVETGVAVPAVEVENPFPFLAAAIPEQYVSQARLPQSGKPPDSRGFYISSSPRLYPRS